MVVLLYVTDEIRGLGNTVSLTIDCRFQPLSYVILDRLTFSEVNAQILLARPSEYFDFRNGKQRATCNKELIDPHGGKQLFFTNV